MKNKFNQVLILLFLFFTTHAYSNPISKIDFIGLNNTNENTLLELIPFKIGQKFSTYSSDQIIDSLFKTGLFENITILKNKNSLEITLNENPTIKYFDVNLNSDAGFSAWIKGEKLFLSDEIVNEHLEENELSAGNIYTSRKLKEFILILESKYVESGYFNTEIKQDIKLDVQNRIGVQLDITQGNRAKIASFNISGSKNISEKELLKFFKIGESDMVLINYFTNKDDFSDLELRNGIN